MNSVGQIFQAYFLKIFLLSIGLLVFIVPDSAYATSQWTRKYDVSCQSCHTAFPRLNYFGERFMRNGYQMPEGMDGNETKTQVGKNKLFIDEIRNLFGMRVNVTPLNVETNRLTKNGTPQTRVSVGNANWLQFFVAGSIFKNVSIFIEAEIDGDEAHFSWMHLGWHNVVGPQGLLNLRAGQLSPMEWHVLAGRLRMIPNLRIQGISEIRTSEGTTTTGPTGVTLEDQIPLASAQPAVEAYGYVGPVVYSAGVSNGANGVDTNQFKNVFGTLKLELPGESNFAGSAVSVYGMLGTDSALTATTQASNRFYRTSAGANIRYKSWDLITAYIFARDEDWDLSTPGEQPNDHHAIGSQLGYLINEMFFTALQYDWIDDESGINDFNKLSAHFAWFPQQQLRVGITPRFDLRDATNKVHEVILNIRAMF